jgi:hypothetical protein
MLPMFPSHVLLERAGSGHLVAAEVAGEPLLKVSHSDVSLQIIFAADLVVAALALIDRGHMTTGHMTSQLARASGHVTALLTSPLAAFVRVPHVPSQTVRQFAAKIAKFAQKFTTLVLGLHVKLQVAPAGGLKTALVTGIAHLLMQRGQVTLERAQHPRYVPALVTVEAGRVVTIAPVVVEILLISCRIVGTLVTAVHSARHQVQLFGRPTLPRPNCRRRTPRPTSAVAVPLVTIEISTPGRLILATNKAAVLGQDGRS